MSPVSTRALLALAACLASWACSKSESTSARDAAPPPAATQPAQAATAAAPDPPPHESPETAQVATADSFTTELGRLTLVPIEHGTLRLELKDKVIYVDPAGKRVLKAPKPADLVLITDIHADHYDEAALAAVSKAETQVIAPPVVAEKHKAAIVMRNGDKRQALGIDIEATPMYNEKRGPEPGKLFHDKGRGNGYLLTLGKTRLYLSGDTECTPEMRALRRIDIAFLTMNLPYTMPPEEAAECVNAFRPKVVYPFHYRGSDLSIFEQKVSAPGVEVRLRNWYPDGQQK